MFICFKIISTHALEEFVRYGRGEMEYTKGTLQGIGRYNVESQNMRAHTGEKPYK